MHVSSEQAEAQELCTQMCIAVVYSCADLKAFTKWPKPVSM